VKNLCKSRAKPKHYEERKTFYRSDTRQPKLLDQVRNRIRCKHYSIRTEQAYIEWIRKFIFYHGKRHPAEMGENEIVEVRVSKVREICCSHRGLYIGAHSKAGGSIIHAYPVDTYSSKREPTITCGGDIVQTTPRPYTPALMTS
jgi:hypothetical protein